MTVILITDFRVLNKIIQSKPWYIPTIKDDLDAIGGLQFDIVIEFNMG